MAVLSVLQPDLNGEDLAPVAAANGGDTFPNDGRTVLYVKYDGVATPTVTVPAQSACSFGVTDVAHDSVTTFAAADEKKIGPFPTKRFSKADGACDVVYSDEADITIRAERI